MVTTSKSPPSAGAPRAESGTGGLTDESPNVPGNDSPPSRTEATFLQRPWISLVILPILTTLLGVLAALYLDDWRANREQRERTIGLLQVATQECAAIISTLGGIVITAQPVFVPSLGIALLNLQQDASGLNAVPPNDFRDLVQGLVGIHSSLSDYGRLANDFRLLAFQPPPTTGLPPSPLPFPGPPPTIPETPDQFHERMRRAQAEIAELREAHLERLRATLQSYRDSVGGFCKVAERIRGQMSP